METKGIKRIFIHSDGNESIVAMLTQFLIPELYHLSEDNWIYFARLDELQEQKIVLGDTDILIINPEDLGESFKLDAFDVLDFLEKGVTVIKCIKMESLKAYASGVSETASMDPALSKRSFEKFRFKIPESE